MANITQQDLPAVTSLDGTETFWVVQSGTDKSATVNQIGTVTPSSGTVLALSNPIYIQSATTVDFNTVADTAINMILPTGFTKYRIQAIMVYNASASMSNAHFAVYSGAGATGATVLNDTVCAITTTGGNVALTAQYVGATLATAYFTFATLYFRVTTPQGSAANASVAIQIQGLP